MEFFGYVNKKFPLFSQQFYYKICLDFEATKNIKVNAHENKVNNWKILCLSSTLYEFMMSHEHEQLPDWIIKGL